ncbi:unnamed protein product [Protopolystoma xenopodis]|uniref:Uncharacterized protein n=1 Tax=Protopolystoma xenopodis TaxID=117903 RepID=A0A448XEL4_9PLAT|nr:unnamed protein product [Protopolystoma xenopodis]
MVSFSDDVYHMTAEGSTKIYRSRRALVLKYGVPLLLVDLGELREQKQNKDIPLRAKPIRLRKENQAVVERILTTSHNPENITCDNQHIQGYSNDWPLKNELRNTDNRCSIPICLAQFLSKSDYKPVSLELPSTCMLMRTEESNTDEENCNTHKFQIRSDLPSSQFCAFCQVKMTSEPSESCFCSICCQLSKQEDWSMSCSQQKIPVYGRDSQRCYQKQQSIHYDQSAQQHILIGPRSDCANSAGLKPDGGFSSDESSVNRAKLAVTVGGKEFKRETKLTPQLYTSMSQAQDLFTSKQRVFTKPLVHAPMIRGLYPFSEHSYHTSTVEDGVLVSCHDPDLPSSASFADVVCQACAKAGTVMLQTDQAKGLVNSYDLEMDDWSSIAESIKTGATRRPTAAIWQGDRTNVSQEASLHSSLEAGVFTLWPQMIRDCEFGPICKSLPGAELYSSMFIDYDSLEPNVFTFLQFYN